MFDDSDEEEDKSKSDSKNWERLANQTKQIGKMKHKLHDLRNRKDLEKSEIDTIDL